MVTVPKALIVLKVGAAFLCLAYAALAIVAATHLPPEPRDNILGQIQKVDFSFDWLNHTVWELTVYVHSEQKHLLVRFDEFPIDEERSNELARSLGRSSVLAGEGVSSQCDLSGSGQRVGDTFQLSKAPDVGCRSLQKTEPVSDTHLLWLLRRTEEESLWMQSRKLFTKFIEFPAAWAAK